MGYCKFRYRFCALNEHSKVNQRFETVYFQFERLPAFSTGRWMGDQAGGVWENANLCLHRNFGFPYISGPALKGIARHAAWCRWLDAVEVENLAEAKSLALSIAVTFGYPTGDAFSPKDEKRTREPAR